MKQKTVKEMIDSLKDKGVDCVRIARICDYHESAIYKVARGQQNDLPYTIGKKIELLERKFK